MPNKVDLRDVHAERRGDLARGPALPHAIVEHLKMFLLYFIPHSCHKYFEKRLLPFLLPGGAEVASGILGGHYCRGLVLVDGVEGKFTAGRPAINAPQMVRHAPPHDPKQQMLERTPRAVVVELRH